MKEDAKLTLSQARLALKLRPGEKPTINSILNLFFNLSFLHKLLKAVNRPDGQEEQQWQDLQDNIRVMLLLHFYKSHLRGFLRLRMIVVDFHLEDLIVRASGKHL